MVLGVSVFQSGTGRLFAARLAGPSAMQAAALDTDSPLPKVSPPSPTTREDSTTLAVLQWPVHDKVSLL